MNRLFAVIISLSFLVLLPLEAVHGLQKSDRYPWLELDRTWTPICEPTPDQKYYLRDSHSPFRIDDKDNHCSNEKMIQTIEQDLDQALDSEVTREGDQVKLTLRGRALFSSGSAELSSSAKDTLDKIAPVLSDYPNETVQVNGHTDNRSIQNERYANNVELSRARAQSVVNYFITQKGLSAARFQARGFGAREPIVPNDTEEQRAQNRRVELIVGDLD